MRLVAQDHKYKSRVQRHYCHRLRETAAVAAAGTLLLPLLLPLLLLLLPPPLLVLLPPLVLLVVLLHLLKHSWGKEQGYRKKMNGILIYRSPALPP